MGVESLSEKGDKILARIRKTATVMRNDDFMKNINKQKIGPKTNNCWKKYTRRISFKKAYDSLSDTG